MGKFFLSALYCDKCNKYCGCLSGCNFLQQHHANNCIDEDVEKEANDEDGTDPTKEISLLGFGFNP